MTPSDLAALLATLRAAGVREATIRPDGTPERLVFGPLPEAAAAGRGAGDGERKPPRDPALSHSRMRPAVQ